MKRSPFSVNAPTKSTRAYTGLEIMGTLGVIALIGLISFPITKSSMDSIKSAKTELALTKLQGAKIDYQYNATDKERNDFDSSPEPERLEKIGKYLGGETADATAVIVTDLLTGTGKQTLQIRELGKEITVE